MDHESADERDVDLVEQAYRYLTDKMYPNGATENRKRAIRNNAKRLITKDEELFYKERQKEKVRWLKLYDSLHEKGSPYKAEPPPAPARPAPTVIPAQAGIQNPGGRDGGGWAVYAR